jgi:hypothetical protein
MSRRLRSEVTPINSEISADPSIRNQVRRSFGGAHNDDPVQTTCPIRLEDPGNSKSFLSVTAEEEMNLGLEGKYEHKRISLSALGARRPGEPVFDWPFLADLPN